MESISVTITTWFWWISPAQSSSVSHDYSRFMWAWAMPRIRAFLWICRCHQISFDELADITKMMISTPNEWDSLRGPRSEQLKKINQLMHGISCFIAIEWCKKRQSAFDYSFNWFIGCWAWEGANLACAIAPIAVDGYEYGHFLILWFFCQIKNSD